MINDSARCQVELLKKRAWQPEWQKHLQCRPQFTEIGQRSIKHLHIASPSPPITVFFHNRHTPDFRSVSSIIFSSSGWIVVKQSIKRGMTLGSFLIPISHLIELGLLQRDQILKREKPSLLYLIKLKNSRSRSDAHERQSIAHIR